MDAPRRPPRPLRLRRERADVAPEIPLWREQQQEGRCGGPRLESRASQCRFACDFFGGAGLTWFGSLSLCSCASGFRGVHDLAIGAMSGGPRHESRAVTMVLPDD